jgi:hypothetical protein
MTDCIVNKNGGCPICAFIDKRYKDNIDLTTGEVKIDSSAKESKKRTRKSISTTAVVCKAFPFEKIIFHKDIDPKKARQYLVLWEHDGVSQRTFTHEPILFFSRASHYWILDYESRLDGSEGKIQRFSFPVGFERPPPGKEPPRICRTTCETLIYAPRAPIYKTRVRSRLSSKPQDETVKTMHGLAASGNHLDSITLARWSKPAIMGPVDVKKCAIAPHPSEYTEVLQQGIQVQDDEVILHLQVKLNEGAARLQLKIMFASLASSSIELLVQRLCDPNPAAPRVMAAPNTPLTDPAEIRSYILSSIIHSPVAAAKRKVLTDTDATNLIFNYIETNGSNREAEIGRMSSLVSVFESFCRELRIPVSTYYIRRCFDDYVRIDSKEYIQKRARLNLVQ